MSSAARYYPRAPRYVFRPTDQTLMRFAGMEKHGARSRAHVQDLSATGLLITVAAGDDSLTIPWVGDMLKIEFEIPGRKQIAWFATVARVDEQSEWDPELGTMQTTFVGLKFHELPAPFLQAIRESVKHREPRPEAALDVGVHATERERWILAGVSLALLALFVFMAIPPSLWFR